MARNFKYRIKEAGRTRVWHEFTDSLNPKNISAATSLLATQITARRLDRSAGVALQLQAYIQGVGWTDVGPPQQ